MKYLPEEESYLLSSAELRVLASFTMSKKPSLASVVFTKGEGVVAANETSALWWSPKETIYSTEGVLADTPMAQMYVLAKDLLSFAMRSSSIKLSLYGTVDLEGVGTVPVLDRKKPGNDLIYQISKMVRHLTPKTLHAGGLDPRHLMRVGKAFKVLGFSSVGMRPMDKLDPFHFFSWNEDGDKLVVLMSQHTGWR